MLEAASGFNGRVAGKPHRGCGRHRVIHTEKQAEDALLTIEHPACIVAAPRHRIAGVEETNTVRLFIRNPGMLAGHREGRDQLYLQR